MLYSGLQLTVTSYIQKFPIACQLHTTAHPSFHVDIRGAAVSNAHSEIFCQHSKAAMRAQCVLVATTLLHSGAKFHSFLYSGSKTVHVNMKSCYGGMSTRLKQHSVTEFLSVLSFFKSHGFLILT